MTAPDGKIKILLNEEADGGQIEEFSMQYNGEGIQHVAFACDDLPACWDRLKKLGLAFMTPPPGTYCDMLGECLPGHGKPVDALRACSILLDGTTADGTLLNTTNIFCSHAWPCIFEVIQRKEDAGFGEGNFK